jgi:CRISPR-associated protein Cas2
MPNKRFLLVVYDIPSDKRRTKLHNLLLDYGTPVQYSVFECLLAEKQEQKMRQAVLRLIRPKKDHVRFYRLCAQCVAKITISGGWEVTAEPPSAIVVG